MGNRQRRGISAGTVILILLTLLTLGMTAWMLPMLTENTQDAMDPIKLVGKLTSLVSSQDTSDMRPGASGVAPSTPANDLTTTVQPAVPTTSPMRVVSIVIAGSVSVPKNLRQSAFDASANTFMFNSIFDDMQGLLSGSNLAICTVESTFAGPDYTDTNAPDEMLDALKFAGVDLISLGNEHALDAGVEGLRTTVTTMESKGFGVVGAVTHKEDVGKVRLFPVNGVNIAVLAYSYGISNEAKAKSKKGDAYATPLLDPVAIRADITNARKAGADLVIVMPHWGTRKSAKVDPSQIELGKQLVAMGADVVVGSHPNVVQRVDRVGITGKDGQKRESLVAYSLGSLLSDDRDMPVASSIVLHFDFQVDPVAHTAQMVRYGYAPIWDKRENAESGGYTYSILRADDTNTLAEEKPNTLARLADARTVVQKVLAEGEPIPVYWPQ